MAVIVSGKFTSKKRALWNTGRTDNTFRSAIKSYVTHNTSSERFIYMVGRKLQPTVYAVRSRGFRDLGVVFGAALRLLSEVLAATAVFRGRRT
jgi:hypothetical protein